MNVPQTPLKKGDQARYFSILDNKGSTIELSLPLQKRYWLIFYRYAGCPLCNRHIYDVYRNYETLQYYNINVIAFFTSSEQKFPHEIAKTNSVPFPLIPDPNREIYSLYEVEPKLVGLLHPRTTLGFVKAVTAGFSQPLPDGDFFQVPGHFLINQDGTLFDAYYGNHFDDHISWQRIKEFMSLGTPVKPPLPKQEKAAEGLVASTDYSRENMAQIVANHANSPA